MNQLTMEQFRRLRDYIYQKTDIYFTDSKLYFVESRLIDRTETIGIDDFSSYYSLLRFDKEQAELQAFMEALTINETSFFRDFQQLERFAKDVIPYLLRQGPRDLLIWSAGCSTGEEAYTLAIILRELLDSASLARCRILATDIDQKVLALAKRGIYGERSLKHLPRAYLKRYFKPLGLEYQVSDSLRHLIEFRQLNLTDSASMRQIPNADVIFCRDVLIYFDDHARRQVARDLHRILKDDGFIFLGHSEFMNGIGPLHQLHDTNNAVIYQKTK